MNDRLLLCCLCLLSPVLQASTPQPVSVAAWYQLRQIDVQLPDGSVSEIERELVGIEYWERIRDGFAAGIMAGYSETWRSTDVTPFGESGSGQFVGLGFQLDLPLSRRWEFIAELEGIYQNDTRNSQTDEFRQRSRDSSASLGLRFRPVSMVRFAAGARTHWFDYRESSDSTGVVLDLAEQTDPALFGEIAIVDDHRGYVIFHWQGGDMQGWSVRFQKEF